MPTRRQRDPDEEPTRRRPATTPEDLENRMVALATEAAEKQLREGTASAQVITHYLKLGSSREKLEQQRLEHENALTAAKIEHMAQQAKSQEKFEEAIRAFRAYAGHEEQE